nr:ferritin-like fold-containing protein [Angustibacter aerolatus]
MTQPPVDDDPFADPEHRAAVVDLLGAMAYGEPTAFSRLAADAEPGADPRRQGLAGAPVGGEFRHYEPARGPPARDGRRRPRRHAAVRDADRRVPRPHPPVDLAGGAGQGLRGRRHRGRLLPRGGGVPRRAHARAWCTRSCRTWARRTSRCRRCAPPSSATPASRGVWRCGDGGSWARRCRRRSGWRPSATRSRRCSSAAPPVAAPTWPRSAACSPGSPRSTPAGWAGWACRPEPLRRRSPDAGRAADAQGVRGSLAVQVLQVLQVGQRRAVRRPVIAP